jgi:hypothetical protein
MLLWVNLVRSLTAGLTFRENSKRYTQPEKGTETVPLDGTQ